MLFQELQQSRQREITTLTEQACSKHREKSSNSQKIRSGRREKQADHAASNRFGKSNTKESGAHFVCGTQTHRLELTVWGCTTPNPADQKGHKVLQSVQRANSSTLLARVPVVSDCTSPNWSRLSNWTVGFPGAVRHQTHSCASFQRQFYG